MEYISAMQPGVDLDRDWLVALLFEIKQLPAYLETAHFSGNDIDFFKERLEFIITRLDRFLSQHTGAINGWVG